MSQKYGDARMPSLRDKIREQAEVQALEESKKSKTVDKVEVKKPGRRLNK